MDEEVYEEAGSVAYEQEAGSVAYEEEAVNEEEQ